MQSASTFPTKRCKDLYESVLAKNLFVCPFAGLKKGDLKIQRSARFLKISGIWRFFVKFATFKNLVQYQSTTRSVAKNLDLMESNKSNKSTFWQWSRKCDLLLTFFNLTEASLL
jgi:hypothetical protein